VNRLGNDSKTADTALVTLAAACTGRGDIRQAEKLLQQVLAHDARHAAAHYELGRIAFKTGNARAAADLLRKAIASQPNNETYHNELGFVLLGIGERSQALQVFRRALEINADSADALTNIGACYLGERQLKEALAAFRRAVEIDPFQLNARINTEIALRNAVPAWHFPMMNDAPRNKLYDAAIRRVAPGRAVLDIGTGAGLLAMMAARAGARSVATCELVPWISAKAKEVVAANGLADRIKLIDKRSTDLQIGLDLSERAEVLVTETFGTMVLNEQVIPTLAHAHAQLMRPGGIVVPRAASARGYLAGGPMLERHFFVDRADGFTLGKFNDFAPLQVCLDVSNVPHGVLSDDFEIFRLDLLRPPSQPQNRVIEVAASKPGRCFGVVQWLRLELVDELVYENRPGGCATGDGWYHMLHRFPEPIELAAGDRVRLLAQHNLITLLISQMPDSAAHSR
jgi:type II protein arginine methyltransferase